MEQLLEQRIRERAYALWQANGAEGNAEQHWLAAEREVLAISTTQGAVSDGSTARKAIKRSAPRKRATPLARAVGS
jgi:hypothetical protein